MTRSYSMKKSKGSLFNPLIPTTYRSKASFQGVISRHFDRIHLWNSAEKRGMSSDKEVVLISRNNRSPAAMAKFLMRVQALVQQLYRADGVETLQELQRYYQSINSSQVMNFLGIQYTDIMKECVGDWNATMNAFYNYIDRLAGLSNRNGAVSLSNLACAWRITKLGEDIQHLTGALICALDVLVSFPQRTGLNFDTQLDRYLYRVALDTWQPWLISSWVPKDREPVDSFGNLIREMDVRKAVRLRPLDEYKRHHELKYLEQMVTDDEADEAIKALSGLGRERDDE